MKIKKLLTPFLILVGLTLFPSIVIAEPELLDPSCKAETKKATDDIALENKADNGAANRVSVARMQAGMNACLQKSLSQTCAQQLKSKSYSATDAVCRQQFEQLAVPCGSPAMIEYQKRFLSHLSPSCQEQIRTLSDRQQKLVKACTDVVERLCGEISMTESYGQCHKDHKLEIAKACPK